MPTLNAPQSATYVTASPQEFVNVICTGANDVMLVSWVGPAGTSGQRTVRNTTSAGEDIGPLLDGTTVNFLAQAGAPGYSAPAFSPPVQSLVSGAGKYRVIVCGDSQGSRLYSSSATGASFLDDGTMSWVQALTQHRLTPVLPPPAVGGTRSADWLTLVDGALALADSPCLFVFFLGTNDIGNDVDVASVTLPNMATIYDKVLARGHKLIVCNVPPYGPTYLPVGAPLAAKNAQRALLNQGLAAYVASRGANCALADIYGATVDPSNVNGYALAADMDTNGTTGLHYSASGARKSAAPVAAIINSMYADPGVHASSYIDSYDYDANSKNRISNPLMLGSGGLTSQGAGTTITATQIATSWQVVTSAGGTATVVCTTEDRTVANDGDAVGKNQVLNITGAGAADLVTLRTAGNINARFATGDKVFFEVYLRASSMVNVKGIRGWMNMTVGGTAYSRVAMAYEAVGASYSQADEIVCLRTPEFEFPAGSITVFIGQIDIPFAGAGGAVVRVGRAQLRKVN